MPTEEYRYATRIVDVLAEFTRFSHRGELNGLSIVKRSTGYWWCMFLGTDHWLLQRIVRPGTTNDPVMSLNQMHLTEWVDEASRASHEIQARFRLTHGNCPDFTGRRETS